MKTLKHIFVYSIAFILIASPVVMGANTVQAAVKHKPVVKHVKHKKAKAKKIKHVKKTVVAKKTVLKARVAPVKASAEEISARGDSQTLTAWNPPVKKEAVKPNDEKLSDFGRVVICSRAGAGVDIYVDEDKISGNFADMNLKEGRHVVEAFSDNKLIFRQYVVINRSKLMTVDVNNKGQIEKEDPNFVI